MDAPAVDMPTPHVSAGEVRPVVTFYTKARHLKFRSDQEGRPVYKNVDYVRIQFPGQDKQVTEREVKDEDKQRFPAEWRAYQTGKEQVTEGIPLEDWPAVDPALRMTLQALAVRTVEQVASMDDNACQNIHGGMGLRRRAQLFLNEATERTKAANMQARNEQHVEASRSLAQQAHTAAVQNDFTSNEASGVLAAIDAHIEVLEGDHRTTRTFYEQEISRLSAMRDQAESSFMSQIEAVKQARITLDGKISAYQEQKRAAIAEAGVSSDPAVGAAAPVVPPPDAGQAEVEHEIEHPPVLADPTAPTGPRPSAQPAAHAAEDPTSDEFFDVTPPSPA